MRSFITSILATSFLIQGSFAQHRPGGVYDDIAFGSVWAGGWDDPEYLYDAAYTVHVTNTKYVCPCDSTYTLGSTTTSFGYGYGSSTSTTTNTASTSTSTGSTSTGSTSTGSTTSGSSSTTTSSGASTTSSASSTSTSTTSSTSTASTLTTTTSTTTGNPRTQTTPYVPKQTGTFNFKAYGNPFVVDGTSLADDFILRSDYPDNGYGIFNNGNTNFYVDDNRALVDQQTGGQAVVSIGANPAVIRFATPAYINDNTTADYGRLAVCACDAPTSTTPVNCLCDGKSEFAIDYRSYLYIRTLVASTTTTTTTSSSSTTSVDTTSTTTSDSSSTTTTTGITTTSTTASTPPAKRDLGRRQVTSAATTTTTSSSTSTSNTVTTPVAATLSASTATTTVTATTCQYPLQTINIVSNGSTINANSTGTVYTYLDGTYTKQTDWDYTNHWQYGGLRNGSFNNASDTGFYGGNFTYDRCSGLIQETTYGRILCAGPGKRQFGPLFIMPYDKIIADGGDLCICNISTTNAISCQCGPSFQFQTSNNGQFWLGAYSAANYANNYPKAVILG